MVFIAPCAEHHVVPLNAEEKEKERNSVGEDDGHSSAEVMMIVWSDMSVMVLLSFSSSSGSNQWYQESQTPRIMYAQVGMPTKKYKKVTGKEIYSDTLESTPMLEKEKFPQDYFPECKWSRKGFIRTRWCITDCAFDLVNIHLFHDASNLIAWETSPSVYSGIRHKALGYVLDRIIDQRFEKVSYFVFGDFNFRLDAKAVVETLCAKATMQTIRAADTNEVVKLIFRESDNDRKVMLQLEKKLFDYFNQDVFRDNNGTALLEFDRELSVFKDRLYELDISFPPSYPYSEDSSQGKQYMNTRCPAWCDRILMSHSAKELILKGYLSHD
ncbi:inositol polyphosphate-5-phosphatase A [Willisornis vidua]|uniref:inositol-polyphosphate 5-phosphatase n=1 Tax=Willisornis vidua TaxID=1566151 RepID=A0ABQ9DWG2_9PASS|nr:inositol polyphosphate-5-phosphatase A [Willisornis vidua]